MIPVLSLGPWDSPKFEILRFDLYQLLALLVDAFSPLTRSDEDDVMSLFLLDGIHLRKESAGFFLKIEAICRGVASGELSGFSPATMKNRFENLGPADGVVTESARIAARKYLEFLANHPDHWPPRDSSAGAE